MRGIFELALAATSVLKRTVDPPACATGVHMMVARGTDEPTGLGRIGVVVGNVTLLLPGSDYEAVDYPATYLDYTGSVGEATDDFVDMITGYHKRCPGTPIALLGYSQGAHALMDAVCGTDSVGFDMQPDLASTFQSSIVAVVTFGDPSHIVNAPWDVGTSKKDGFFPRGNITGCEPYSPVIRGWCDVGDVFCDSGEDKTVHGGYFSKYTGDATKFIVDNYKKAIESSSSTTSSTTSSASTTVTPGASTITKPQTSTTASSQPSTPATPTGTSVPSGGSVMGPSVFVLVTGMILSFLA